METSADRPLHVEGPLEVLEDLHERLAEEIRALADGLDAPGPVA